MFVCINEKVQTIPFSQIGRVSAPQQFRGEQLVKEVCKSWIWFCFSVEIVVEMGKFAVCCCQTTMTQSKNGDRVRIVFFVFGNKYGLHLRNCVKTNMLLFYNAEFNLPFSVSISLKSRSEFFKDRTPGVSVSCSVVDTFGLFSSGSVFIQSLIVSFFTIESHLGVSFRVVVARSPQRQLIVSSHQFSRSSARITTLSEMARTSSCERFAEHRKRINGKMYTN